MNDHNLAFRRDLQGLRAIAIVLVVLAHSGLAIVEGGFIGVDVFFVLSGYLITGLLLRELEHSGRIAFMRFYARRLKRLLPALMFMLCISFGVAMWLLSGAEARIQLASSLFTATWTSNLYFAFSTIDYFNELASRDLFLHTWSLGVEEQFYLIWPMVLLTLFRVTGPQWIVNENGHRPVLLGLGTAFIASFALFLYWTLNMPQSAFYLMPSRIWQLSLGAMVYLAFQGGPSSSNGLAKGFRKISTHLTLGVGLILILGSAIALNPELAYSGIWILVPSLGAALVIVAGHTLPEGQDGPLAQPVLVWLGNRSYSLYLWHWPVFILGFSMGFQGQVFPTLGMMLLSMLAAMLSFRLVELPFWKGRWSHVESLRTILLSVLIMATVVLVTHQGFRQLSQAGTISDLEEQWRSDLPDIYHMPCDAWYIDARIEPCVFGVKAAKKTVVFLGDSIGLQWFSLFPEIFKEPLWRIVVLTKSSCAMVDEDYYYPRIGKIYQVCTDWRNAILDELDIVKPDVLIMGSAATYGFSETQWIEGSSRVFERVSKSATSVFVIPGTPSLGFDGPGCVSRHFSLEGRIDGEACVAEDRLKHVEPVTRAIGKAADRFPNVHMLNLNALVCPGGDCRAIDEAGMVIFRDSRHLTDSFVRAQLPVVRGRLKELSSGLELSDFVVRK